MKKREKLLNIVLLALAIGLVSASMYILFADQCELRVPNKTTTLLPGECR